MDKSTRNRQTRSWSTVFLISGVILILILVMVGSLTLNAAAGIVALGEHPAGINAFHDNFHPHRSGDILRYTAALNHV